MTMLPRTRHVVMATSLFFAMTSLVAPSFATNNLVAAPTAAQVASIKSFSKIAVAQRKAALKAGRELVPANKTLAAARAKLATAQVPLNAAMDIQSAKLTALTTAKADLVNAQAQLAKLVPPKPQPKPSPSSSTSATPTSSPSATRSASPSATPSQSASPSRSATPRPTQTPTAKPVRLPIELVTPANAMQVAHIKVIQQSLNVPLTGKWDAVTKTAFIKFQQSIGYKGTKANGRPDKKSLAALVKHVKAVRAKLAAAAQAKVAAAAKAARTKAIAAAKVAISNATAVVDARQKELTAATAKVTELKAVVTGLQPAVNTAAARVAALTAAKNAAQNSYKSNLSRLNAITSVTPYSSDICVPGQEIGPETSWDCGVVTSIADGDTITVKTDTRKIVIRTLGVQAPEVDHLPAMPAQCGGYQASAYMKQTTPVGTVVQLRSRAEASFNAHTSVRRFYREIYIKDSNGNFTVDTADELYKRGLAIWFPLAIVPGSSHYEAVPNKRYFQELLTAIAQRKGMWSTTLCPDATIPGYDPQRDITPQLWALMDPPGTDNVGGPGDPRAEYIVVKNPLSSTRALDLSYWKLRDTALNFFMFPKGTLVKPGHVVKVYVGKGKNNPSQGLYFFNLSKPLFQNYNATLYQTTGYLLGDGVYLADRQGPNHSGGNMRAWFHNPCVTSTGRYTASCGTLVTDQVTVPNVVGQLQADAVNALKAVHLAVKIVKVVDATKVGKVTEMLTVAGTRVDVDTAITIKVAGAPAPTPTPTPTTTPSGQPSSSTSPSASATP